MAIHDSNFPSTSSQSPTKAKLRAGLYARCSTVGHGQHPEMQLAELRAYCARRGYEIAGEYVDAGISGAKERRPELDRLIADCRKRKLDAVVVYRYDRFARSLRQLVGALEEFGSLGVDFISLHEGVDTSTPNGRLIFGIFATISEFERELIRDRVRSGLAHAKAKGVKLGRRDCVVNTSRVEILRGLGLSWGKVSGELGISIKTIQKAMRARSASTLVAASSAEPGVLHV